MEDCGGYLENKPFYNVDDVAEMFNVSKRTVRRWISEGLIVSIKPTRKHLISSKSIRNLILSGTKDEERM